jgi:hypothetical protein
MNHFIAIDPARRIQRQALPGELIDDHLAGTYPAILPAPAAGGVIRAREFPGHLTNRSSLREQDLSLSKFVDDLPCGAPVVVVASLPPPVVYQRR